ncbi:hypothetical protein AMEX_G26159 [Astyanax mexicanus]|uniref:Immunoglobulin V-set domain-containing protein n=1 Tax=Astyanax mexicanus TaxID=7994 RepID=A0A8T2KU21_ASTMX|nr:hypothetical protein AMEX_G26159 [Astyanax mexicanus]
MLRSFTDGENIAAYFYNTAMKGKVTVQVNHSLLIHNITEEDLGDYYCVASGALNFSTGTRLYRTESSSGHVYPHHHTPWLSLILASAVLNCIFIAAIVGE